MLEKPGGGAKDQTGVLFSKLGAWSRGIRQDPTIDPDPLDERSKPRIAMQRVERRVLREEGDERRSFLHGALEPQERILLVGKRNVDQRDVVSGDVALLRQLEDTIQLCKRCLASPGQCQRLRAKRVAALCLQRMLVAFGERASGVAVAMRSRIRKARALSARSSSARTVRGVAIVRRSVLRNTGIATGDSWREPQRLQLSRPFDLPARAPCRPAWRTEYCAGDTSTPMGIELLGARIFPRSSRPIMVVLHHDVPQRRMRRREVGIDGERFLDGTARFGKHFLRSTDAEDAEDSIAVGKTRIGECIVRIACNGLLEEADRLQQTRLGLPRPGQSSARIERVRFRIVRVWSAASRARATPRTARARATFAAIASCTSKIVVKAWSKFSAHSCWPSATLTNRADTLRRSPRAAAFLRGPYRHPARDRP